jgi:hypothetical protein
MNVQESRPSIIKDGAVLEPGISTLADGGPVEVHPGERSGLLRGGEEGPRDGRAVIHTDSD